MAAFKDYSPFCNKRSSLFESFVGQKEWNRCSPCYSCLSHPQPFRRSWLLLLLLLLPDRRRQRSEARLPIQQSFVPCFLHQRTHHVLLKVIFIYLVASWSVVPFHEGPKRSENYLHDTYRNPELPSTHIFHFSCRYIHTYINWLISLLI